MHEVRIKTQTTPLSPYHFCTGAQRKKSILALNHSFREEFEIVCVVAIKYSTKLLRG